MLTLWVDDVILNDKQVKKKKMNVMDKRLDRGPMLIVLMSCLYVGLYLLFYPAIFAYRDEANYFAMAYVLKEGSLFIEQARVPVQAAIEHAGRTVPIYPIGNSLGLLPFTFLPWQAVFFYGLIWHLVATRMIYRLATLFNIEATIPTILYLFYPSLTLYSRTLMSDVPTIAIFLSACVLYFDTAKPRWMSGLLFGVSILLRPTNLLLVGPFGLCLLVRAIKSREFLKLFTFVLAMCPFAALVGLINYTYYGSPLANGYTVALPDLQNFSLKYFMKNYGHYLLNLNLSYPLMLIPFFFVKELRKVEVWILVIFLPLFFSFHYFYDRFPRPWMDMFFSNRFLFPVIAFLIIAYGKVFHQCLLRMKPVFRNQVLVLMVCCLIGGTMMIHQKHAKYLEGQAALRDLIYEVTDVDDVVIYDEHTAELIQGPWGRRTYVDYQGYDALVDYVKQLDGSRPVYLVQRKFIYNQEEHIAMTDDEIRRFSKLFPMKILRELDGMTIYSVSVNQGA